MAVTVVAVVTVMTVMTVMTELTVVAVMTVVTVMSEVLTPRWRCTSSKPAPTLCASESSELPRARPSLCRFAYLIKEHHKSQTV